MDIDQELYKGYQDGADLDCPNPTDNRSNIYKHGFINGRDDAEVYAKIKRWPSRTAQQSRDALALILEPSQI